MHTLNRFLFLLTILFVPEIYGQNNSEYVKNTTPYSASFNIHFIEQKGFGLDAGYFFNNKYSITAEIFQTEVPSKNTPSDYQSSRFILKSLNEIGEKWQGIGVFGGYMIPINKTRTRVHLKIGLFWNRLEYPDNFIKKNNNNWVIRFGENYTYDIKYKKFISIVFSPVYEIAVWNHFGIRLIPKIILQNDKISFMGGVSLSFGNVTNKIKKRKKKK